MFHTVSCRPFSANSLFRRTKPSSVRPDSVGLAGIGMMALGFIADIIRLSSCMSSSVSGLLKHLAWRE